MPMFVSALVTLALGAAAQPEISMRADDPATLMTALREMGFSPDPLDLSAAPTTLIEIDDSKYFIVLGGCNDKKKGCQTVMVGARFTDLKNVPLDWVNKQNEAYDLLKVWRNKDGELGYSVQAPARGMTRTNFRALIDGLISAEGSIAKDATDAKLVEE